MGHGSDGSHKWMGQMGHHFMMTHDLWVNGSRWVDGSMGHVGQGCAPLLNLPLFRHSVAVNFVLVTITPLLLLFPLELLCCRVTKHIIYDGSMGHDGSMGQWVMGHGSRIRWVMGHEK